MINFVHLIVYLLDGLVRLIAVLIHLFLLWDCFVIFNFYVILIKKLTVFIKFAFKITTDNPVRIFTL